MKLLFSLLYRANLGEDLFVVMGNLDSKKMSCQAWLDLLVKKRKLLLVWEETLIWRKRFKDVHEVIFCSRAANPFLCVYVCWHTLYSFRYSVLILLEMYNRTDSWNATTAEDDRVQSKWHHQWYRSHHRRLHVICDGTQWVLRQPADSTRPNGKKKWRWKSKFLNKFGKEDRHDERASMRSF